MQTTERQLLTIVAEAVVEQRLIRDVKDCGALGYSLTHVRGEGPAGLSTQDLTGPSVRLETVVTDAVADAILDLVERDYFGRFAVVAWLAPVRVARPERF
jgi:hypothetical protein